MLADVQRPLRSETVDTLSAMSLLLNITEAEFIERAVTNYATQIIANDYETPEVVAIRGD